MSLQDLYSHDQYTKDLSQEEFDQMVKDDNNDISIDSVTFTSSLSNSLTSLLSGEFEADDIG